MLLNMHIKNIALIEEIDIAFDDKLNILTGETGAGKSIIIGALGICLGGRFSKELLRDDSRDGLVELSFSVESDSIREALLQLDVEPDAEDQLLISRRLSANGRTINRVNDNTVTVNRLREIASILIDLHAQHEQQTLLQPAKHLELLDRFGGEEIAKQKDTVKHCYDRYQQLLKKQSESMDESQRNKQMDFLQYQIQEITKAHLVAGEEEQLESQYKKAKNAQEIMTLSNQIHDYTGAGANSAITQLSYALSQMKRLVELDDELSNLQQELLDAETILSDFNVELSNYMQDMDFDAQTFFEMEKRLDEIHGLEAKYGPTIEEILAAKEAFEQEYEMLLDYEQSHKKLEEDLKEAEKKLEHACGKLTTLRVKESKTLCEKVRASLSDMNFQMVAFEMRFTKTESYHANGRDEAVFYLSTNIGQPLRPLQEIASGGELSRVMLAMKACLANQDDTPTLVFDEIDVGISGRTAQKVAEKMSILGRHHQVICITHLPQIAAMADTHFMIEKTVSNRQTITNIRKLSKEEEIEELARLIGGAQITETTMQTVEEMKGLAQQAKKNP